MSAGEIGAKPRDYWWTVLAIDPLAVPATAFLARRRWLTPDQVTWASLVAGLPMGLSYATGTYAGLVAGALLWYVAFLLDCIDGKLARATGTTSDKGRTLDALADGGRRLSGSAGLAVYLYGVEGPRSRTFWLAVAYGLLAFYFSEISGGTRAEPATGGGRWSRALARRRLLPTPGAPDAAAIVFFVGPLTGLVVPALIVGDAMFAAGIAIVYLRMLTR